MTDKKCSFQKSIEDMVKNWPEEDTNLVAIRCTGVERNIPPESTHKSAIEALKCCALARKFGETDKGWLFLTEAQNALSNFVLLDAAIKGEKFKPCRTKGSISDKTIHINQLANDNPELSSKLLYKIADKSILGKGTPMQISTFNKKVSEARNPKK